MEDFVAAGHSDRMRRCGKFLVNRFESDMRKVVVFTSENLALTTTIIQVRDGSMLKKPEACSTLCMTLVPGGIAVSAYEDTWYNRRDWMGGFLRGAVRLMFGDEGESSLTVQLYNEAKAFLSCGIVLDAESAAEKCGKCDWRDGKKAPCQRVCTDNALSWTGDHIKLDAVKCTNCGKCVAACKSSVITAKE